MRLIATGGAGFIGSAVVSHALRRGHEVLTIDKLTYAERLEALADAIDSPSHQFIQTDIADGEAMAAAFRNFGPDMVVHLAAESHVDRSIDTPGDFLTTNVQGTFVLLEFALQYWSQLGGSRRDAFRFIHVSTDEVFGTLAESGTFDANSR
jgi:dTDP-glucose 4,6-dehydratase